MAPPSQHVALPLVVGSMPIEIHFYHTYTKYSLFSLSIVVSLVFFFFFYVEKKWFFGILLLEMKNTTQTLSLTFPNVQ